MRSFLAILVVALLLRLTVAWGWQRHFGERFVFGDSESYWALGRAASEGGPYQFGEDRVFRTPGYPLILAPLFWIGGPQPPVFWARVEGALLGTAAVAAVWWLGRTLFDARVASLAATLAAVYPGAAALSVVVLSEAAFCPLVVLHLAAWARAARESSQRRRDAWALAAGLLGGAATLVRPSWLLFVPLAVATTLLYRQRGQHLRTGLIVLAGLIFAMLPWWVRNYHVVGHFVATTLQVGASLYDGLNPAATGASQMQALAPIVADERQRAAQEPDGESLEFRLDRRLRAEATAWAWSHPSRVAHLACVKLGRMWNLWPNEPAFSAWPVRLVVGFAFLPSLILGLIGIRRTVGRSWPYILCWLPAVYLSLLHMVFVSSIRYREPAMLPLLVLAAAGVLGLTTMEGCGLSSSDSSTSVGSSSNGQCYSASWVSQ